MTGTVQPSWRFIEKVPCPQCGVPAGERCRSPKGIVTGPHGKRRVLAAQEGVWIPGAAAEAQPS